MKILVIGSGGREHAIIWKLAQTSEHELIAAPGNAGIEQHARCIAVGAEDLNGLAHLAEAEAVDLVVVGPEAPLAGGLVDRLTGLGINVFGPAKAAAQLEGSKIFAKEFCYRHRIPTAAFDICTDSISALAAAENRNYTCVIKADGLAAGKGVFVCRSRGDVDEAIDSLFVENKFGDAADRVVVEDCLVGEEASILALVDGDHFILLESSQDHKAAYEGDKGPNTGGMGAYSPAPVITPELKQNIHENIIKPVVDGMKADGNQFQGVLYAGLMIVDDSPWVLEFNVRFGDPETQPVLMRLETDLAPVLLACAQGKLNTIPSLNWKEEPAVCVVLASEGYPGNYKKGLPIRGLENVKHLSNATVFHAGTRRNANNEIVTNGGRVLGVTATGATIADACKNAYQAVDVVEFSNKFYRSDIAHRALNR